MPTKLPHLSDDHHFAITNVAARASQLENHIEKTIEKGLLKQPKMAEFLLKNLGADRVVRLLKAILLDAAPEEESQIDNLIRTINDLRTDRNEILHWTWGPGEKEGEALSATSRPFREFRYSYKTPDQIQKIADEMTGVSHALMEWQHPLHKQLAKP